MTYSLEFDSIFNALDGEIRDAAIVFFKKYANIKSEYQANDSLIYFINLEIPKAKIAAGELYELIINYIKTNEKIHHA